MASRAWPLGGPGQALAVFLLVLILAPLMAVAWHGSGFSLGSEDGRALRFSVVQAVLSAAFSTALAVPLARALARRRFFGRRAFIVFLGAPFLLPAVVAVLGLLAIFGRSGVVNDALTVFGIPPVSIYGLHGVVLAHVFLNLPLATRMILQGWTSIPTERLRLAQSLGFRPHDTFRHLEFPMLREVLPGTFSTILLICMASFAVVISLGGGPRATTIELAIYQAVRFDFDLGRAAGLAALQFGAGCVAAAVAWRLTRRAAFGAGLDRQLQVLPPPGWRLWADVACLFTGAAFLGLPVLAIVLRGMPGMLDLEPSVWYAAGRSVMIALCSAAITAGAALVLTLAGSRRSRPLIEMAAALPLATSGLVLGIGLFLLVQPLVPPMRIALPITLLVNVALSLPYLYRLLLPEVRTLEADYGRLAESLSMAGWSRLRWIVLPRLAQPLGFGAGIAAALSMGDLGVIALFAGEQQATLPLVVSQLAGAYRMDAAASAALLLVVLSLALFWVFDAGGRRAAS